MCIHFDVSVVLSPKAISRLRYKGSHSHYARVTIQGVLSQGIADSGAYITIIAANIFQKITDANRTKKTRNNIKCLTPMTLNLDSGCFCLMTNKATIRILYIVHWLSFIIKRGRWGLSISILALLDGLYNLLECESLPVHSDLIQWLSYNPLWSKSWAGLFRLVSTVTRLRLWLLCSCRGRHWGHLWCVLVLLELALSISFLHF